ncbi:MAG TPA: hypothetical protein VN670_06190 [Acidobacteriaceae bacterium]|nr:hypothetical protein [Acidobacteriaceae bacterium]
MHDNIGMVSKLVLRHARWSVLLLAAGFFCTVSSSFGQKTDVNVNLYGAFPSSASASPYQAGSPPLKQTADPSAGFRIGARHIFSPILGVELNFGYNSATQHFTGAPFQTGVVYSHAKPFTVDYVASAPFTFSGIRPFVLAGGGVISYNISSYVARPPGSPGNIPARPHKIPTFEYGVGFDYHFSILPNFMSMRFQYRGLIAHAPDYKLPYLQTSNFTNIAEPQAGLVFKF